MSLPTKRALGHLESQMALMHEQAGTTQTCSAVRLSGRLTSTRLHSAVRTLQARHALLRCCIEDEGTELVFSPDRPLDTPPLTIVDTAECPPLDRLLEQELADTLDAAVGLWRLTLYSAYPTQEHCLLLTCHHAIADAVTLPQLLGELLILCASTSEALQVSAEQGLPLPLEAYQLCTTHRQRPAMPPAPPHQQQAALGDRRTRVIRCIFPEPVLTQLLSSARHAQLSLNSLLAAALLQSASRVGLGERINLASAVNLRQRVNRPIPDQQLGCYIGVACTELCVDDRPLLELAASYQAQLRQQLPDQICHQPGDIPLSTRRTQIQQLAGTTSFSQGIALTNHGVIELPKPAELTLLDYANVAARCAGNFAVAVHATTFQNSLSLCFTFVEPLTSTARIEQLRQHLCTALMSLLPSREIPA